MVKKILLLGTKELYEKSEPVEKKEIPLLEKIIEDLHDTLLNYRARYGAGRAIAAPQIGVLKRMIYMYIEEPIVFINPVIEFIGEERMKVMDDCMSFPGLYVEVERYKKCKMKYLDINWNECEMILEGDLSELLQHEYDHLDGILATMRGIDNKAFYLEKEKAY